MAKDRGIQLEDNPESGTVMDVKINVRYDGSGKIAGGLVVGNTLQQNKALILLAHPGEFKLNPDLGVGIQDMLLSEDYLEFRHRIREHFAKDGLEVTRLDLAANKPLRIDAEYNN